jgi:hypothetical protein
MYIHLMKKRVKRQGGHEMEERIRMCADDDCTLVEHFTRDDLENYFNRFSWI